MYRLSTSLVGHDDDVKTLAVVDNNCIVSGSRDSTVRIWNRSGNESKDFDSSIINHKSEKFINSLAIYKNSELSNGPLIASAGNDNIITLTDINSNFLDADKTEYYLVDHRANVCSLDVLNDLIISGSWDSTAKVWNGKDGVLFDLKGHENSVWSAKFLSPNEFITCGADRTIRKWKGDKEVKKIIAHDDVIRDLLLLPNGDFASCSNDSSIKIWDINTLECKATLLGHQSFIYSLALLSNGDIVSCGEDRSVRIWRHNQCIQVITLPCISIWKVAILNNDDIITASSDSIIRIFTRNESRFAKKNEFLSFQKELEDSSVSESVLSNINKDTIPGMESLNDNLNEPKIEGETKLIKSGNNNIDIFQWTENKWIKIGTIVDSSSSNQKQFYKGDSYDYVFNIDVEDGKPPLKLPVNISDNPYEVAETFLADNELPYSYLQEIVNFIMQNAEGISLEDNKTKSSILPQREYLKFDEFNQNKFISAFNKLNDKQPIEKRIDKNFGALLYCEDFNLIHQIALEIIENWDEKSKLIAFDLLRSIITKIKPSENLFPIISSGLKSNDSKIQMMTIRILINTFSAKGWGEQIMLDEDMLDLIFTDSLYENLTKDNKFLPVTVTTLILNLSVLINKFQLLKFYSKLIPIIERICLEKNINENEEASYRLLVGIGTLNYTKQINNKSFLDLFTETSERIKAIKKEIL